MVHDSDRDPTKGTQVIHIDFQRKKRRQPDVHDSSAEAVIPTVGSSREPITDLYTGVEVCRLLGLSRGRLRGLDKQGIISPSGMRGRRRAYTFSDLIALRTAAKLFEQKARTKDVAAAIQALHERLPQVTRPLSELRITHDGRHLMVRDKDGTFEATTGQMMLDFEVKKLREDVVQTLRPAISVQRTSTAYDLYLKATKLDENPETFGEAERLYKQALQFDPYLAIAYTNLGNISFRRGDDVKAVELYEQALRLDPSQAEAHYNLGYVMLDRERYDEAVEHFEQAIDRDKGFADAYFNLAMALEQAGREQEAKGKWRLYLELEPDGPWADFAKEHLGTR